MPVGIRYQERCVELLTELGEVGIQDETLIRERHFPNDNSGRACPKKMTQYINVGLVEVLEIRGLKVYRLTQFGAEEVERLTGRPPKRVGRGDPPKEKTLLHRLGVIRVRLAFDDACKHAGFDAPDWIMEYDPAPGAKTGESLDKRFKLCESFSSGSQKRHTCWADLAGQVRFPSDPPWELLAYYEYDRSTMTSTEISEKLPGYERLIGRKVYERHWPSAGRHIVRVLFICKSEQRIANLIEIVRSSPVAACFRFATEESLQPVESLFTRSIWHATDGEIRPILKTPVPISVGEHSK